MDPFDLCAAPGPCSHLAGERAVTALAPHPARPADRRRASRCRRRRTSCARCAASRSPRPTAPRAAFSSPSTTEIAGGGPTSPSSATRCSHRSAGSCQASAVDGVPLTLIDGFITHQQYRPATGPDESTFVVTGEDVSVKMDLVDYSREFPAMPDSRSREVLAPWLVLGIAPTIIPSPTSLVPVDYVPQQAGTDRAAAPAARAGQRQRVLRHARPTCCP